MKFLIDNVSSAAQLNVIAKKFMHIAHEEFATSNTSEWSRVAHAVSK